MFILQCNAEYVDMYKSVVCYYWILLCFRIILLHKTNQVWFPCNSRRILGEDAPVDQHHLGDCVQMRDKSGDLENSSRSPQERS